MPDPFPPLTPCPRRRSRLAQTAPNRRPQAFSPRAYQARLDLCHVYDFLSQGKRPAEIARAMGKDPAWVSRAIKKLQQDPSTIFETPTQKRAIQEQLARFELLRSKALCLAGSTDENKQLQAIRLANSIIADEQKFLQYIGVIRKDSQVPYIKPPPSSGVRFIGRDANGQLQVKFDDQNCRERPSVRPMPAPAPRSCPPRRST